MRTVQLSTSTHLPSVLHSLMYISPYRFPSSSFPTYIPLNDSFFKWDDLIRTSSLTIHQEGHFYVERNGRDITHRVVPDNSDLMYCLQSRHNTTLNVPDSTIHPVCSRYSGLMNGTDSSDVFIAFMTFIWHAFYECIVCWMKRPRLSVLMLRNG